MRVAAGKNICGFIIWLKGKQLYIFIFIIDLPDNLIKPEEAHPINF